MVGVIFLPTSLASARNAKGKDSQAKKGVRMSYQRKTKDRWDIMTNWDMAGNARTANIPGMM